MNPRFLSSFFFLFDTIYWIIVKNSDSNTRVSLFKFNLLTYCRSTIISITCKRPLSEFSSFVCVNLRMNDERNCITDCDNGSVSGPKCSEFFLLESVFIEINAGTSLLIIYIILTAFVNCLPLSKIMHN